MLLQRLVKLGDRASYGINLADQAAHKFGAEGILGFMECSGRFFAVFGKSGFDQVFFLPADSDGVLIEMLWSGFFALFKSEAEIILRVLLYDSSIMFFDCF